MKDFDLTLKQARELSNRICNDFKVPECYIWFILIPSAFQIKYNCAGWYEHRRNANDFPAYAMIDKTEKDKLLYVLHELAHHLQYEIYDEVFFAHGKGFFQARNRIATWAKNNISDNWKWDILMTNKHLVKRNG